MVGGGDGLGDGRVLRRRARAWVANAVTDDVRALVEAATELVVVVTLVVRVVWLQDERARRHRCACGHTGAGAEPQVQRGHAETQPPESEG